MTHILRWIVRVAGESTNPTWTALRPDTSHTKVEIFPSTTWQSTAFQTKRWTDILEHCNLCEHCTYVSGCLVFLHWTLQSDQFLPGVYWNGRWVISNQVLCKLSVLNAFPLECDASKPSPPQRHIGLYSKRGVRYNTLFEIGTLWDVRTTCIFALVNFGATKPQTLACSKVHLLIVCLYKSDVAYICLLSLIDWLSWLPWFSCPLHVLLSRSFLKCNRAAHPRHGDWHHATVVARRRYKVPAPLAESLGKENGSIGMHWAQMRLCVKDSSKLFDI